MSTYRLMCNYTRILDIRKGVYIYRVLTFSGLGFSGKHAQETASVFSGLFNGIFETHFWQNSNIREPRFSMHLEGAQKCMMILREELAAWLGLAWLPRGWV